LGLGEVEDEVQRDLDPAFNLSWRLIQNKTSVSLKLFFKVFKHYNYLQFTQITKYIQNTLKRPNIALLDLGLE